MVSVETEVWAGSTVKPRDDQNKIHPDLRPFERLTKQEQDKNKDFIIKLPALLAKFGFQIDKPS